MITTIEFHPIDGGMYYAYKELEGMMTETINLINNSMKNIELNLKDGTMTVDGKRYLVVEAEKSVELTLDDCLELDGCQFTGVYPTTGITEKVLLFGLLHSVAYKLNRGMVGNWSIRLLPDGSFKPVTVYGGWCDPEFSTRELAEQAIRMFEKSDFDLKKLYV